MVLKKEYSEQAQETNKVDYSKRLGSILENFKPKNKLEFEAFETLKMLRTQYPQTSLNGLQNIWILKPAGLSRGRGISMFNSLKDIIEKLQNSGISWVIQKYMEHPLLYKKRKLDIRQWVLVTSINPLNIWFYEKCYIRLTHSEYTLNNIKNRFAHLTNNSVNKYAENFDEENSFLSQNQFQIYLKEKFPKEKTPFKKIQNQMKEQVRMAMSCGQDSIEHRPNTGEIYGFDFCVDEQLGVWLIEINSSPDFSFSSVFF